MTDMHSYHISKLLVMLSLIFSFSGSYVNGQEEISGVVNRYAKVNSISPGSVFVSPAQATQFSAGDYALLIQMQGVGIRTSPYGTVIQQRFGTPGGYEFLQILSVNTGTGEIRFTRNVYINTYNVTGTVQLIQIPFYDSPSVTATLTSQSWNSTTGTGGVLAIMVGKKLTLNADIDVTGQGFSGAPGVSGIGECVYTNIPANSLDSYDLSWNNAGLKGEGVAIHDDAGTLLFPAHAKGQGRNFTGGGGGNGRFSGGGGGSNRGKGADGGIENALQCSIDPRDGGYGGMNILGTIIQEGIFLGGGAGGSTQATGSTASAGGNGGGIVIIIADSIDGNNHIIRSNGITALNSVSDAGAGGGGAGGSVALSFQAFNSPIRIATDGGNGGTSPGGSGEGGGGGGGLVWLSTSSMPVSVTSATVVHGSPAPTIPAEGTGEIKYNYSPNLNGFLFNVIRSRATGNQTDSVCSNILYGQIVGTRPVGGTPPYTFQWQSSTTSALTGFSAAPGTNDQQNYTPPAQLTQTTWFRRVVTDFGAAITDVSLPVRIIVHPYIKNNVIGNPDTVCYGQNSPAMNSVLALQDGNGKYTYKWESSTDNSVFTNISASTESFLPPAALIQTTWYRRTVNSGACIDVSAAVRINVLEVISNNSILTLPQEICNGMTFVNLEGSVAPTLSGGDNTYKYLWESSTDNSLWATATGTSDAVNYDPDESASYFPGQQYFRRIVYSGIHDVCKDISSPVLLNEYPVITDNLVTPADQTICSGSAPVLLNGSMPLNGKGAGSYTYTWQDSTKGHSWADITGYVNVADQNFAPPALTDTVRYRRIVYSSACYDISKSVLIKVHKPITNNTISLLAGGLVDTTICSGATPHRITGLAATGGTNIVGNYTYQWSSSPDNISWTDISASTGIEFQPSLLAATIWFRRRAVSGQCSSESGAVKITVLPVITNNTISVDQIVCKSDTPELLTQSSGSVLTGGTGTYSYLWEQSTNGIVWNPAVGNNNQPSGTYQPPVMTKTMKYRRITSSGANGCCTSTSNVLELVLDSLPAGSKIYAGPDTAIYSFDRIVQLVADPPLTGGTGKWTLVSGSGSFENETDNNTKVTGLSIGLNTYLWTVTRGACKIEDEVMVSLYDLVIPEGFSPNNDPGGYNNTFRINGLDLPNQTAELTVINGAGAEVFRTSNLNGNEWSDWDGKNSKGVDLPEGTYYYLLRLTSNGNGQV
ncbi:MAG: gliding motility-associated C-terminal domain-containing protein, partial [Candidatus Atribacteria bacterium]